MGRKPKISLSDKEIESCNNFKKTRIRYDMSQKEWADAIGVSLGLVKGIEGHMRKCTESTKNQVENYKIQHRTAPDSPDVLSLEKHVLSDVFLTHMGMIGKNEAISCADSCMESICEILSNADKFKTKDEQKLCFQHMDIFLDMLISASYQAISAIKDGLDVLDIAARQKTDFIKELSKNYKDTRETPVSKEEAEGQMTLPII